jgi:putative drug exporter of the RND superfamily
MVFWLLVFIAGGAASSQISKRLSFDFSLPGQPGYETGVKIEKAYGISSADPPELLVLTGAGGRPVAQADADRTFAAVAKAVPAARVIGQAQTGDPIFSTADGGSRYAYAWLPQARGFSDNLTTVVKSALYAHAPPGVTARVSGLDALQNTGGNSGPGVLAETLLGGVGALAILAFVFASLLALIPLLIAAVAILATFLVIIGVTTFANVSFIVQFLVSLVGLGVAIDYSLLIVTRWREERDLGRDNHDAVVAAMETAGHAVVFSGLTVAIGLFALVVLPVPFLRSIGYGGMLIPLISVAVAITLLPAVLGGIGPRVDWPRIRREGRASRFWTGWARMIVRFRIPAVVLAVAILGVLLVPLFHIQIGTAQASSLARTGPAYEALTTLEAGGVPRGALTPAVVLTRADAAAGTVARLRADNDPALASVTRWTGPGANVGGNALVLAIPRTETANGPSVKVVTRLKHDIKAVPGTIGVSGVGALQIDYLKSVYGNFPYVLAVIVVVTFLLLARAFRSLLLPLKAVLLNLLSVGATFGGLVFFWQDGHGSKAVYNVTSTGAITFWLPLMVFAFLFGLSMDYEVFILSRMREEYQLSGTTDGAVVAGLGRTGRLVTSAALILFLAFISLSSGPETDIKVFATGLGFGILLDATVVRMLLVPALVSLFGRWNWYLPPWAARLLFVEPSRAAPEPPPVSRPRQTAKV